MRDRLAAIVRGSDDAIYSKDVNARVDSWNPAAERLYGYAAEEAIGRHISFIVPSHRAGEETTILDRILVGERIDHYETQRLTKSGLMIDVSITVSPVRAEDGRVVGASVTARDIADRKRLQELQQAIDRTEFIARAAHELRNPIAALVGFTKILSDPRFSADQQGDAVEAIARQGDRLNALMKDLLDLSYVESGRYDMNLAPVSLREVVDDALAAAPSPDAKHVRTEIPNDLVVIGDSGRMSQIFLNLLTNAYKYGGDRIAIEAEADGDHVALRFADNGPGVPVEIGDTLFDPFVRGHRDSAGSGLGLTITARLIQAQGGHIRLDPAAEGTRFVIQMQRAEGVG